MMETNALSEGPMPAHWIERDGISLPGDYGDGHAEYAALRAGAGLIDLAHWGVLCVEGRDRVTWLHKLVTTNVQSLSVGESVYTLLLNAKGHVAADFVLFVQNDALWLYTSKRAKEKLFVNLRRAIFREKVSLTEVSDSFAILSLQGPQAALILNRTNLNEAGALAAPNSRAGSGGFDLLVPREHETALWDALVANGARPVGFDALNTMRIEAGIAWYGDDFDEDILAPEAQLESFIAENKGCYTGQEVIARIKNRGHVNRLLVRFLLEGDQCPRRGDPVFSAELQVGWVSSAVRSFAYNAPLAFGYLRRELAEDGARVEIRRGEASLRAVVINPKS